MIDWHFYATIYNTIAVPLQTAVNTLLGGVIGYVRAPLLVGITLWIGMNAGIVANGGGTVSSLYRSILQAGIIVVILQSTMTYNQYVGDVAQAIPREVGQALSGGGTNVTSGMAHDLVWNQAVKAGLLVWEHIPSYNLKGALMTLCVAAYFVVAFAAILGGFGIYLLSSVSFALLLATGPLFVALYPFPGLRRYFNGWFAAVVSAILTQVFSVAVLALLVAAEAATVARIVENAGSGADANFVSEMIVLLEAAGLMYLVYRLLKQTPAIASSIAGGVYHNVSNISSMPMAFVSSAAGMAGRAASGVAGQAIGQTARAASVSRPSVAAGRSLSGG